jgi:3-deoxy-D-manno-octulosonic-acid transferase
LRNPSYWDRFGERFGFGATSLARCIWVHAVSVGEVQAAAALIRALQSRYPRLPVVITTTTPTGAERAERLFGDAVHHSYLPIDLPGPVRRFFDRVNPCLAIILETELWPTLYNECGRRQVPLVLASARVSPGSVTRYRRLVNLFKDALSHGIVIAAQSEADADRFKSIGANPDRTHVTGNIKFDFELPENIVAQGEALRRNHAPGRRVWIAASTHQGEEEIMLEVLGALKERIGDSLLILVPRHPERFAPVADLLRRRSLEFVTRSSGKYCTTDSQVLLVDTLGELQAFYAASDVAFVGGSLVPIGGHNLLEPAALGLPVVTGPHNFNAEEIAEMFVNVGAAAVVHDAAELTNELGRHLEDAELRARIGAAGRKTVEENRGALERLLALVDPLVLDPSAEHSSTTRATR